jgi:hypothetical protein
MDDTALTRLIRKRLASRILPMEDSWRRRGEYSGRGLCDGCGERTTSAQASYAIDFHPGVTPVSVRFHRNCFEIWQRERQIPPAPIPA